MNDGKIYPRLKSGTTFFKDLYWSWSDTSVPSSLSLRSDCQTELTFLLRADRASLQPRIHHYRAHHVQSLDALFPILPLNPLSLLYSILGVPLPIPAGPKDPAPPNPLPGVKVDERTTAAALGYVAMIVQIMGNLGGAAGGLPYPVTCAGSRSLVKDVVSVMQGPRS